MDVIQRAAARAAAPSFGRAFAKTSTAYPRSARTDAAAYPSPPLFPGPQITVIAALAGQVPATASATARPAADISRSMLMPFWAAARSTASISAVPRISSGVSSGGSSCADMAHSGACARLKPGPAKVRPGYPASFRLWKSRLLGRMQAPARVTAMRQRSWPGRTGHCSGARPCSLDPDQTGSSGRRAGCFAVDAPQCRWRPGAVLAIRASARGLRRLS